MYNLFKRSNAKLVKSAGRTTASAITDMLNIMLPPAAPKKRAKPKAKKTVSKKPVRSPKAGSKTRSAAAKPRQQPKAKQKPKVPATSQASITTPRGASFEGKVHACEHGERSYKLYIPTIEKTTTKPLPVLVMLHGCSQTAEDFARGTGMNVLAEEFGFFVIYPNQARKSHKNRCWNWFRRSDQSRGSGEPALIASLTRQIIDQYQVDPARVYIAGLSAGASTALITANAYPDIFAAVGAHSGLPAGAAHDTASAMLAMRHGMPGRHHTIPLPTINFHGDADKVVNPRNSQYIAARASELYPLLKKTEKIGYATSGQKYVRTSHRLGSGRSFIERWLVADAGHAWSGGNKAGGFTNPSGPDASREMVRFFLRHRTTQKWRASFPN